MAKISIEDLKRIKERERSRMVLREGDFRAKRDMMDVMLTNSGCAGLCAKEPMITVEVVDQAPVKYILVDKEKALRIFEEHVVGGNPVEDYALAKGSETQAT